jgi:hypothetical protein
VTDILTFAAFEHAVKSLPFGVAVLVTVLLSRTKWKTWAQSYGFGLVILTVALLLQGQMEWWVSHAMLLAITGALLTVAKWDYELRRYGSRLD